MEADDVVRTQALPVGRRLRGRRRGAAPASFYVAMRRRDSWVVSFPISRPFGPSRVPRRDLPLYFESDDVQIAGLVVSNYSADPSHWASQQSLGNWLAKAGVPAIFGADSA